MEKIKIPTYSNLVGIKSTQKEMKDAVSKYIHTKDKEKIKTILLEMKDRFPNAKKMIDAIDKIINDEYILNKCVVNETCNTGLYTNISVTLCPLRDEEQSGFKFSLSSPLYYSIYEEWKLENKNKNVYDFIKENDIETIFITVNTNTNFRLKIYNGNKNDLLYVNYKPKYDPQYKDIQFMESSFK